MKIAGMMITRGRQMMAAEALHCWVMQDYGDKSLVILDDTNDRSFPDGVNGPNIQYALSDCRVIGAKRNLAAAMTDAEYIAHFDSDDLSSPERLSYQIAALEESGRAVCGFSNMMFHEEHTDKWRKYEGWSRYATGTSLLYRRDWWESHHFDEIRPIGSDNRFVDAARDTNQLLCLFGDGLMAARSHADNSGAKHMDHFQYKHMNRSQFPNWYLSRLPVNA